MNTNYAPKLVQLTSEFEEIMTTTSVHPANFIPFKETVDSLIADIVRFKNEYTDSSTPEGSKILDLTIETLSAMLRGKVIDLRKLIPGGITGYNHYIQDPEKPSLEEIKSKLRADEIRIRNIPNKNRTRRERDHLAMIQKRLPKLQYALPRQSIYN